MDLNEAINIINYEKCATEQEQLEAQKVFWKELFKVDVQNMDGTYRSMNDIMEEASQNLNGGFMNV